MSEELEKEIMAFIREQYMIPDDDAGFTSDAQLFDDGYIDSFGVNDLIEHLESKHGVTVEDQDISQGALDTVKNIVEMMGKKKS